MVLLRIVNWFLLWLPNFETHEWLSRSMGTWHTGYPVWSDVGSTEIAGVLKKTDDGVLLPPRWTQVNPRYQVVVATSDAPSEFTRLGPDVHSNPLSIFDMRSAGYILVNFYETRYGDTVENNVRGFHMHSAGDGQVSSRRTAEDLGLSILWTSWFHAVPSWDGSRIAAFTVDRGTDGQNSRFEVAFVAADSLRVLARHSFESQMGAVQGTVPNEIKAVWDGGFFTLSDMSRAAWRLSEEFPPEVLPEPLECAPFPTASGRVRGSDRMFVTVADGHFKVTAESEAELPAELCPGFK